MPSRFVDRAAAVEIVSFAAMAVLGLSTLVWGLLPGLLAACAGFALTMALGKVPILNRFPKARAFLVIVAPIYIGLMLVAMDLAGDALVATAELPNILEEVAQAVVGLRQSLPSQLAVMVPSDPEHVRLVVTGFIRAEAFQLIGVGRSWLHGALLAYVGLIVGALAIASPWRPQKPLAASLLRRAASLGETFNHVFRAQLFIALFNACCTGLLLWVLLPLFDVQLPYRGPLVVLTFVLGLIPIVGNLVVNGVLAAVGSTVSISVACGCLLFLVLVHKAEYALNAAVMGRTTRTSVWELLAAMFVLEAIFGVSGLVAAPLFYGYLKSELGKADLV